MEYKGHFHIPHLSSLPLPQSQRFPFWGVILNYKRYTLRQYAWRYISFTMKINLPISYLNQMAFEREAKIPFAFKIYL